MKLYGMPLAACFMVAVLMACREFCPFWPALSFIETFWLFLAGLIGGIRLPDLDLRIPGLSHRSAITHSCLPAVLLWVLGDVFIAAGLALGIALHLSSDLQPKSWAGGALIKLPILGSIGMLSPLWLIVNIVGCFAMVIEVISGESVDARQAIVMISVIGSGWYFLQEEKRPLLPLMTLGFAILLVHAVKGGTLSVKMVWQYFA
ncbi:hypothetical protein [uncultured Endozoicomonas sp.]|uniref:hypothetical protein n=1 Tax=uncultured Endozoicomonas sp. TaxID=432652 RepID=UPI00262CC9A5|nr:hypothetical protein [uncultured Endozoicomonas sp.]